MKNISIALVLTMLLATACRNEPATSGVTATEPPVAQAAATLTPEQLGALGAEIKKQPNNATRILEQHGLTEETFEQAIRKVAEDPQASKRYADAYHKASA